RRLPRGDGRVGRPRSAAAHSGPRHRALSDQQRRERRFLPDGHARGRALPEHRADQLVLHGRQRRHARHQSVRALGARGGRGSLTSGGDATTNLVYFRFIFQPLDFTRTISRVTPVHNFVDDLSYIRGNHTFSLGANVRLIKNSRTSFGGSYDSAITNPSFYDCSAALVLFVQYPCTELIF